MVRPPTMTSMPATVRANLVFSAAWGAGDDVDYAGTLESWTGWLGGRGLGDSWLRVAGMFTQFGVSIDSIMQAKSAPYTGWGGFYYDSGVPRERMKEFLIEAARNDIRISTITTDYFELFEEVNKVVPIGDKRWVVGHLDAITEDQARRLADLGVAMSTHTNRYIYKHGHLLRDELGPDRENDIVPMKRLREAGVHVSLATDNVPTTLFWSIASQPAFMPSVECAPPSAARWITVSTP